MSKSAIYTALTVPTEVESGSVVPLGATIRRFGNCNTQDGNIIKLCGCGYWAIQAVATIEATSASPVSIAIQKDGVDVLGAKSSITVAGTSDQTVLPVIAIVRNKCECGSAISFVITADKPVTVDNLAVTVEKL